MSSPVTPDHKRSPFRSPRTATEARDADQVAASLSYLNGRFRTDAPVVKLGTTLWAGARLWWDEASEADTRFLRSS